MKRIAAIPGFLIMLLINAATFIIPMTWLIPGWIKRFKNPGPLWRKSTALLIGSLESIDAKVTEASINIPMPIQFLILIALALIILSAAAFCYLGIPIFIISLITSLTCITMIPTIDLLSIIRGERYPLTGIEWYVRADFTINLPGMEKAAMEKKEARAKKVAEDDFREYEENRKLYEKYYSQSAKEHGYSSSQRSTGARPENSGNSMSQYEKSMIRMQYSAGDHFTKSQLKKRYRKLAAIAHPDGGEGSDKSMSELTEAYEYLVPYAEEDPADVKQ